VSTQVQQLELRTTAATTTANNAEHNNFTFGQKGGHLENKNGNKIISTAPQGDLAGCVLTSSFFCQSATQLPRRRVEWHKYFPCNI